MVECRFRCAGDDVSFAVAASYSLWEHAFDGGRILPDSPRGEHGGTYEADASATLTGESFMRRFWLVLLLVAFGPGLLCAQRYEIAPYAGGFFPGKFVGLIDVKNEGIYGLKGGVFLTRRLQIGGNAGYISDLSFKETLTRKRAYIWDGDVSVHAGGPLKVYGVFGMGGVVTTVSPDSTFFFDPSLLTR